jgi:Ca-activated chloride channel family protein
MDTLPGFTVLWPDMLWGLILVPLLGWLYWRLLRRGRSLAVRFPSLEMVGFARTGWRRWTPAVLLLAALASLLFATARPQAIVRLPSRLETVILAVDMSGSMRATDIQPSRIFAAQQAAKDFIAHQPHNVSVGVVAVAGTAAVVQSPSRQREEIAAAIDRLQPQRGTALGSGLIISLATVLPAAGIDVQGFINGRMRAGPEDMPGIAQPPEQVEPGSYPSAAIVLLSDGQSNTGPDPLKAADIAAQHGVRIFTVGVGTAEGTTVSADGWSMKVRLDDTVLKKVAQTTGGEYFQARDAAELQKIYTHLSSQLAFNKEEQVEISALFAALGAVLAIASALLSMLWFGRVQ